MSNKKATNDKARGGFKVKRLVTLPLLKPAIDKEFYILIQEPIFKGKELKGSDMEAAHLVNIINLETGQEMQLIANAVLRSTLEEEYPEAGYVGKGFALTKEAKPSGKKYNPFTVVEIELPD